MKELTKVLQALASEFDPGDANVIYFQGLRRELLQKLKTHHLHCL